MLLINLRLNFTVVNDNLLILNILNFLSYYCRSGHQTSLGGGQLSTQALFSDNIHGKTKELGAAGRGGMGDAA